MKKQIIKTFFFLAVFLMLPNFSQAAIVFEDNFDASPDWQSAESYPSANAIWPNTWKDKAGGPSQPPPQNWTSYRAAIPRWLHDSTFILGSEGARDGIGKGMTYNLDPPGCYGGGCWVGGGLDLSLGDAGYQEIYVRFYLKYDPNTFHWGTIIPNYALQKLIRISRFKVPLTLSSSPQNFSNGDQTPTFYPDFHNDPNLASNKVHFEPGHVFDPVGGGLISEYGGQIPWPTDGEWHSYEFRVKMNSAPGVADGEWEFWLDDLSDSSHHMLSTSLAWVGSESLTTPGWNWLTVLDNMTNLSDSQYYDTVMKLFMDDFVVSTSYIGTEAPVVDVTAPAAPTGLSVE